MRLLFVTEQRTLVIIREHRSVTHYTWIHLVWNINLTRYADRSKQHYNDVLVIVDECVNK